MPSHLPPVILFATLCATLGLSSQAMAQHVEQTSARSLSSAIGARVGGYGFRQLNEDGTLINWENCRMNGVGIFGGFDLGSKLYSELSMDMYHATAVPLSQGIDRLSFHTQGLLGFRIPVTSWLLPHVHLGGGAEFTRVEIFGREDRGVKPVGFAGVGGELVLDKFRFGMTIRSNLMQLPEYQWNPERTDATVEYTSEMAGQMLFSIRYIL